MKQQSQDTKLEKDEKTKITILTGFLGSGKTTFINNILKFPQLKAKIAVIQNDFTNDGIIYQKYLIQLALGIQTSMMTDGDGNIIDDFFEMPNGCICCTVKDDLVATIDTLLQKKNNIQHIIIQTNGLADPSSVIQTFWLDQELQTKIKLHKTTGIIDCNNFQKNLKDPELKQLLMKQLIFADQILLNKIVMKGLQFLRQDACDKARVDFIQTMIQQINPYQSFKRQMLMLFIQVFRTSFSKIQIDQMLSRPDIPVFPQLKKDQQAIKNKEHVHATQTYDFHAFQLPQDKATIDIKKFQSRVANLLWEEAAKSQYQILRMKGTFISNQSKQYLLQRQYMQFVQFGLIFSVVDTFELKQILHSTKSQDKKRSKLLVIGKNISNNAQKIAEFLQL